MPNSEISGPTISETLLAKLTNENANAELELLIEFGMLLGSIEAKAAEMGISEVGDTYACDQ